MRRIVLLSVILSAVFAASAQATTVLKVNGTTGSDTGNCQGAPCKTIQYAITQGEAVPDLITIDVSAGTYTQDLSLGSADSGLTIAGVGSASNPTTNTVITGVNGAPMMNATAAGDTTALTLEHLRLVSPAGDNDPTIQGAPSTDVELDDVAIDSAASTVLINATGDVSTNGGSISMTSSSAGPAIDTAAGTVTLANTPVSVAGTAPGILAGLASLTGSPLTMTNTSASSAPAIVADTGGVSLDNSAIDVKGDGGGLDSAGGVDVVNSPLTLEGTMGSMPAIAVSGALSAVSVSGSPIIDDGESLAIVTSSGPAELRDVKITLNNAANTAPGLVIDGRGSSLSHVTISGTWQGLALVDSGSMDIVDSSFTSGPASPEPVVALNSGSAVGDNVLIERSTLMEQSKTVPTVAATDANVAIDSSELLGGITGVDFAASGGNVRTLTLASSTVDAGTLGVRDASPVFSLDAHADNMSGSAAIVNVEGSILVEPPTATVGGSSGKASVNCTYTEVPATTQAASSSLGAINCGDTNGNTSTPSLASIFAHPGSSYALLNPSWNGVDSVPASAIDLPAPFTDSSTDLLGNPRVINGVGTCTPGLRDKGAIELTGHSGVVPAPSIGAPANVFAGASAKFSAKAPNVPSSVPLSFSWKSSDGASGTGADFSHRFKKAGKPKITVTVTGAAACTGSVSKKITVQGVDSISHLSISPNSFKASGGASVTYTGSVAATTRFTVQLKTKDGYVRKGSFTHHDAAGKVKVHLSGHKLAPGSYRLELVTKDGAGKGKPVYAKFTIEA